MAVLLTLSSAFLSYTENEFAEAHQEVYGIITIPNGKMAKNTWIKNGDVTVLDQGGTVLATSNGTNGIASWYYLDTDRRQL